MWLNADSVADGSSSVEVSQISRGSDLSTHFFPRSTTVYGCVDGVQCVGRALLCNANDKKQQRRDEKARGEGQGRLIVSQTINYTIPLIEISSSSTQDDGGGGWVGGMKMGDGDENVDDGLRTVFGEIRVFKCTSLLHHLRIRHHTLKVNGDI
ncbi:hypothetical protein Q1695_009233 [Nippostrongylus brasiliensis]|nr:hypothetical protein Q1695_009233 [Nippostrongylus brasiliensis]